MDGVAVQDVAVWLVVAPVVGLLWAAAFCGLGLLVARTAALHVGDDTPALLRVTWLGYAVAQVALIVWSLVGPVNATAAWTLLAAGAAGLRAGRLVLKPHLRSMAGAGMFSWVGHLGVGWLIANRAVGAMVNFDSAMYEFPGMTWAQHYAVVPGLANLHSRLGLNNANVLMAAAIDRGPWAGHAHHILNGLLLALLAASLRAEAITGGRALRYTAVCLVGPLLIILQNPEAIASITADTPATCLSILTSLLLLKLLWHPPTGSAERSLLIVVILACAVAAVATKLSALVIAGGTSSIVLLWWGRGARPSPRATLVAAAIVVSGAAGWLTRGAIMTGYAAYPSEVGRFDVEWAVPSEARAAELDWIRHDNRYAFRSIPIDTWPTLPAMLAWFRSTAAFNVDDTRATLFVPAVLIVLGSVGLGLMAVWRRGLQSSVWIASIPSFAAAGLWWVMAPTPQFGFFVFWIGAATTAGQLAGRLAGDLGRSSRAILLGVLLVCVSASLVVDIRTRAYVATWPQAILLSIVHPPHPDDPIFPVVPFRTASGLLITYPAADERCGRVLFCTPHPAMNLSLRRSGDPGSGFRVDGPWRALWYPARQSTFRTYWRDK